MKSRQRRNLEVISISALDLFASALGVFILMSVLLFPYYLRQPSTERDLEGARAEHSQAGLSMTEARLIASQAEDAMAEAEALRSKAIDELQQADASKAEAEQVFAIAARRAKDSEQKKAAENDAEARLNLTDLDLVFVMDATGSMGQELRDVQVNLLGLVRVLQRLAPSLNVGFVAFKDRSDEYLTRTFPLAPMNDANLAGLKRFVERLSARGGGDQPEPVGAGLGKATSMNWRREALGWSIVVGDAPAHRGSYGRVFEQVQRFHRYTPLGLIQRRVSSIFTGRNRTGRKFYQELAQHGGGDFVDHQGRMIESILLSILKERPS